MRDLLFEGLVRFFGIQPRSKKADVEAQRRRAAQHGVSMEEEARRILKAAVAAPERLGDLALETFGPNCSVDLQLPVRAAHEPMDLSE